MGGLVHDQLLELRDLAGIFGGTAFGKETVTGQHGKVDAVEGSQKFFGEQADAGQRFALDETADIIHGKTVALGHFRGDAQRVGQNSQILFAFQQGQYFENGGAGVQKDGAAIGDQGGHPLGNALFEQFILFQARIPSLDVVGNAGVFDESGAAVDLLDEAFLLQNVQIAAYGFDGNAKNIAQIFIQELFFVQKQLFHLLNA